MVGDLFLLMLLAAGATIAVIALRRASERQRKEAVRLAEAWERQRVEQCGEVVLFFANYLGYIARQVILREELEQLIDDGISRDDLFLEIGRRIREIDGLVIGYHQFGSQKVDVKLTEEYRDRHVYIVGKSGSGKTTLIRTMLMQDLKAGHGVGVLAPEAEMLTEEILPFIPEERLNDVIYFNPADSEAPVCFNPLHLDEGEDLDIKVDENLTLFKRLTGEPGPRMDEILRQALYALISRPGSTLLDVERLLDRTDPAFRNEVVRGLDERAAHFWNDVYPSFPKDAHLPITNRLGRFLSAKSIRAMLCSPGQSLNFRNAMDSGKILLFNVSDGLLGEQNSQLLGQLIVTKFQMAVMSRAQEPKADRRRFFLYIDEFQTFTGAAGASYERILSRARKYRLGLILAHQQTGQIPVRLLQEILGNVSTTICFQVSREDAVRFSKELITEYDGEVVNVSPEEILRLNVGQAWCKMGKHAFQMKTKLPKDQPSAQRAAYVIERSRHNYGRLLSAPDQTVEAVAAPAVDAGQIQSSHPLADLDPENPF